MQRAAATPAIDIDRQRRTERYVELEHADRFSSSSSFDDDHDDPDHDGSGPE